MRVEHKGKTVDVPLPSEEGLFKRGYHHVYRPNHPNAHADGYIPTHRYVMSQVLGRPLRKGEQVHHIDGNRDNNHPENLELTSLGVHQRAHTEEKVQAARRKEKWWKPLW